MTWEFVDNRRHECDLPDPTDFIKGDQVRCTTFVIVPEPPVQHRAKDYKTPEAKRCLKVWTLNVNFWSRRKYWYRPG